MKRRSRRSQLLRDAGVPIAIASDCNPGTSPLLNPQLVMNMACTLFGLTPEEAIAGMTINAARALGLAHEVGSIEAGKAADLCVWRVSELSELGYWIGMPGPERRIFAGRRLVAAALFALLRQPSGHHDRLDHEQQDEHQPTAPIKTSNGPTVPTAGRNAEEIHRDGQPISISRGVRSARGNIGSA